MNPAQYSPRRRGGVFSIEREDYKRQTSEGRGLGWSLVEVRERTSPKEGTMSALKRK